MKRNEPIPLDEGPSVPINQETEKGRGGYELL
jgi:hypothetical protein